MAGNEALPLFPLHTVLFPGRPLPLHIFEPRYRLMIGHCLEADRPFGVVLIRAGLEVGDAAEPYAVGTRAEIVQHDRLPDGRLHLLCVGRSRFRICELQAGEPYLAATVQDFEDEPDEQDVATEAARLGARLAAYATAVGTKPPTLPSDPTALSFAAAGALPLALGQRQALLEMQSVRARLLWLVDAIEREARLRGSVGETRPAHPHGIGRLSSN